VGTVAGLLRRALRCRRFEGEQREQL